MRSMRAPMIWRAPALLLLGGLAACSAADFGPGPGAGGAQTTTGNPTTSAATGGAEAGGAGGGVGGIGIGGNLMNGGASGAGGVINCVPGGMNDDVDGDGYTPAQGDCEDCDPRRNPNAVEV